MMTSAIHPAIYFLGGIGKCVISYYYAQMMMKQNEIKPRFVKGQKVTSSLLTKRVQRGASIALTSMPGRWGVKERS